MIYAIPHSRDCIANHFMKAMQFSFVDEENHFIDHSMNPGHGGNSTCRDKKAAINLLKQMRTDAVIVRHIGQRSLGKLLDAGIRVFQVSAQTPIADVLTSQKVELFSADQGRPSNKHEQKGGCSGHTNCSGHSSCSGHSHHHMHGHGVRRDKHGHDQTKPLVNLRPLK